jgi:ABC-type transport system involved in multi-copper enzyme maturation permease subunit
MAKTGILRRFRVDWPLLGKELLEQASRRHTYVLRVLYALVFFGAFIFYYMRNIAGGPVLVMGRGLAPFMFLVRIQLFTIFLFLPPMMAGAIAQEKERDTLGLLFLTDLSAWELILQKYVGRLIPMLTLLFLALPLMAVTYSLGGVSVLMLCSSAESLFLMCLAVGALTLECSSHEATTFRALMRSWLLCLFFMFFCWSGFLSPLFYMSARAMSNSGLYLVPTFFNGAIYLVPTWLFLVRAKQNLEARAFVQRRNLFGQQFKHLDHYWKDVRKLTRAMLRARDQEAYSLARQVVRKQAGWSGDDVSIGHFLLAKMQVPNLIAFGIILGTLGLIFLAFTIAYEPKSAPFLVVTGGLWIVVLLTLPIQSANAVASERMNERLNVMLTTPLTSRELLDDWLAPVRRWINYLSRPLLVIVAIEAVVKFSIQPADSRVFNTTLFLAVSVATVAIYPRLVQWVSLWIGLRVRSQMRAMMTAFLLAAAWCFVPLMLASYLRQTHVLMPGELQTLEFASPVTVIGVVDSIAREKADPVTADMIALMVIHLCVAGVVLWSFRRICLKRADEYLGRV